MSEELKLIEDKAITIYEDMIPKFVKGKPVYPKAYFEDDVKKLIKSIKDKTLNKALERYFLKMLEGLPSLYLKKGHTCSSKTKRMDIDILITYLNKKKEELRND